MFRYNPKANYQPNGGRYLQILSGKDLYKPTIVVSEISEYFCSLSAGANVCWG